jgi:hypothetical protein
VQTTRSIIPHWRERLREELLITASWAVDADRPVEAIRNKLRGALADVNHLLDLEIPDPQ